MSKQLLLFYSAKNISSDLGKQNLQIAKKILVSKLKVDLLLLNFQKIVPTVRIGRSLRNEICALLHVDMQQ